MNDLTNFQLPFLPLLSWLLNPSASVSTDTSYLFPPAELTISHSNGSPETLFCRVLVHLCLFVCKFTNRSNISNSFASAFCPVQIFVPIAAHEHFTITEIKNIHNNINPPYSAYHPALIRPLTKPVHMSCVTNLKTAFAACLTP